MKIQARDMQIAAGQASDLLKTLANPHRLLIVCQLLERECSVGQLADFLAVRDSTVSQHLALLRKDGMVTSRRDGQTIWYSISSAPARELLMTLYRIYCSADRACEPAGRQRRAPERGAPARRQP